jgi:hypothetical protein
LPSTDTSISRNDGVIPHQNSSPICPTAYRSSVAVVTSFGSVTEPDSVWPVLIVLKSLLAPDGTTGTTCVGTPADVAGEAGPDSLIASPASAGAARLAARAGVNPPPAG